jgi:hypothetical protein
VLSSYAHELGQRKAQLAVVKSNRLRALVLSLGCLLLGIAILALALRHSALSPALWASIAGIVLKRTRPQIAQVQQLTESLTVLRQGLS